MKGASVCYMIAVLAALVVLVYGFMDVLRKPAVNEQTSGEVLSRQIRGFGLIILAPIVLSLGGALCMGKFGMGSLAAVVRS